MAVDMLLASKVGTAGRQQGSCYRHVAAILPHDCRAVVMLQKTERLVVTSERLDGEALTV